jgi:hypothetical protein
MERLELQDLFNNLFPYPPLSKQEKTLDTVSKSLTLRFNLKSRFLSQPTLVFVDLRHIDDCIYADYTSFFKKVMFRFNTLGCLRQAMIVRFGTLVELDLDEAYERFDKIYAEFKELYYDTGTK